MVIKLGSQELLIKTENVEPLKKGDIALVVDRVRVYAHYLDTQRNLYSSNYIDIPLEEESYDLKRAINNFTFEHNKYGNNEIVGYQLYYVNRKMSLVEKMHRKIGFYNIKTNDFKYNLRAAKK